MRCRPRTPPNLRPPAPALLANRCRHSGRPAAGVKSCRPAAQNLRPKSTAELHDRVARPKSSGFSLDVCSRARVLQSLFGRDRQTPFLFAFCGLLAKLSGLQGVGKTFLTKRPRPPGPFRRAAKSQGWRAPLPSSQTGQPALHPPPSLERRKFLTRTEHLLVIAGTAGALAPSWESAR